MVKLFLKNINEINTDEIPISKKRAKKISRLKNKNDILLSVAAEAALNEAVFFVCGKTEYEYDYNENGKPYLKELPYHISISHSGEYAICAISDNLVGVDIQRVKEYDENIINRFFLEKEKEFINAQKDKRDAFFTIWTQKEALSKLTGKGIGGGFSETNVINNAEYNFKMYDIGDKNYKICICLKK